MNRTWIPFLVGKYIYFLTLCFASNPIDDWIDEHKNILNEDIKSASFQLRIKTQYYSDKNDTLISGKITDIKGNILIISQFTLLSDTTKGRRPSFINAAKPDLAEKLYDSFINKIKQCDLNIKTGKFGAMMDINLTNNGPATFILNSNN